MLSLDFSRRNGRPYTVLCLGAHCDDIEIGCGGTILKILGQSPHVATHWVVFSSNSQRGREARESARAFLEHAASTHIIIKNFRNSFFPFVGAKIKEYFEHLKATIAPDLIFTHHRHDLHQDHQLLSRLTWNTFRDHLILEYEIPKYDGDLGVPNVFSHLEESICRRKVDLILGHYSSQKGKHWFGEDTFFALLRLRGMECNSPSKYAEAFHCRKLVFE